MKVVRSLVVFSCAILCAGAPALAQSVPASNPALDVKVEEIPAKLTEIDQKLAAHLKDYLAVIDREENAKRLSTAYAESLRWSGKEAVEGSMDSSFRPLVTTARSPSDNRAVFEARAILDAALGEMTSQCKMLVNAAQAAIRKQISEALKGSPTDADFKTLSDRIESMRGLVRSRTSSTTTNDLFISDAINAIHWLQVLSEAETSQDARKLRDAVPIRVSVGNLLPEMDRKARVDRAIHSLVEAFESQRAELNGILEAGKPKTERDAAVASFEQAADRLASVGEGFYFPPSESAKACVASYRQIIKALAAIDAGDTQAASNDFVSARVVAGSSYPWTAWVHTQTSKWLDDLPGITAKHSEGRRDSMNAQLAAVKSVADLDAMIESLASAKSGETDDGNSREESRALQQTLRRLSTVWSSANPAFLQEQRYDSEMLPGFSKELAALRKRVERDVVVKAYHIPELNQPPLAGLPLDAAMEKLTSDLVQRGEWKRVNQVLEGQMQLSPGNPAAVHGDLMIAVRSYLAAQNFELAEQWSDAMQAYKEVLRCTSDLAPTAAAAERLKALVKAHPEATTSGASPASSTRLPALPLTPGRIIE